MSLYFLALQCNALHIQPAQGLGGLRAGVMRHLLLFISQGCTALHCTTLKRNRLVTIPSTAVYYTAQYLKLLFSDCSPKLSALSAIFLEQYS